MTIADEIQRFLSTGPRGGLGPRSRGAHPSEARPDGSRAVPGERAGAGARALQSSIVFLTPRNIVDVLRSEYWLKSAWDIANLYLGSIGAALLGGGAPDIVGISEETRCYVSARYFEDTDRFADYVVHEAAHIFHNCKRETVGLPHTRYREWLLEIDFVKRETFAYACEAYSRMCEIANRPAERPPLVDELASGPMPADERVDREEYLDILRAAAARRNGWKVILERCAPPPRKSMAQAARERHEAWVQATLARMRGAGSRS